MTKREDTETPFCEVYADGSQYWYVVRGGELVRHRLDGPAVENVSSRKAHRAWYRDGKLHREDGPALETITKVKTHTEWRIAGELHRLDGPALEYTNENQTNFIHEEWYRDGKLHCEDGPAITKFGKFSSARFGTSYKNVEKWYLDGQLHRDDGPAVEHDYGDRYEWHFRGHRVPAKFVKTDWFDDFKSEFWELWLDYGDSTLDRIRKYTGSKISYATMQQVLGDPHDITLFRLSQGS